MTAEKVKDRKLRKEHRGRPRISEEIRNTVVTMYNNDVYIKDIADKLHISAMSVHRILNEKRELQKKQPTK